LLQPQRLAAADGDALFVRDVLEEADREAFEPRNIVVRFCSRTRLSSSRNVSSRQQRKVISIAQ
jgi:hypothetical protein